MMLRSLFMALALWTATTVAASARIYTWTDNQGTVHFTEDAARVPAEFRKNIPNDDEKSVPAEETLPAPSAVVEERKAPPLDNYSAPAETALSGGKTRDQWQQELAQSEAALAKVRQRLEEISATVSTKPVNPQEYKKLVAEDQNLRAQYNEMKDRYFQLVEAARKAGFRVNLQQ